MRRALAVYVLTLVGLIVAGVFLLKLPVATLAPHGTPFQWIDAIYTSVSATCGVGLTSRELDVYLTTTGQTLVAVVMQAGALVHMMVICVLLVRVLAPKVSPRRVVAAVLCTTFAIELLAAVAMWPAGDDTASTAQRAGWNLFHAISAYSQVGLTLSDSRFAMGRFVWPMHAVIVPLMFLGSVGLPVLVCLPMRHWYARAAWGGAFSVYIVGVAALMVSQCCDTNASWHTLIADRSFLSASARTTGLSTLRSDHLSIGSQCVLMVLMVIGVNPGSAGGGVGPALILILARTVVGKLPGRGHHGEHDAQCNIKHYTNARTRQVLTRLAWCSVIMMALLVTGVASLLACFEPYVPAALMFESISASTGTGLPVNDLGMTRAGTWTMIAAMFAGRMGPAVLTIIVLRRAAVDNR